MSDPKQISAAFCQHFVDYPKAIQDSIPAAVNDYTNLIQRQEESLSFQQCTEDEIRLIIMKLKKEGELKDIPRKFLRLCIDEVCNCIATVFNNCIDQGVFPASFKLSKITPVYKKENKKSPTYSDTMQFK